MTKLYKKTKEKIIYWEIWKNDDSDSKLIVHWGELGFTGEVIQIKRDSILEMDEIYLSKIQEKKEEGFIEWETMSHMILQFKTDDTWGDVDDLDFRNKVWDQLNEILGWTGNGRVGGGDIGSGTNNIFFEVVDPEIAITSIVSGLDEVSGDKKFIVAMELPTEDNDDDVDFEINVLYPAGYESGFSY